MNYFLKKHKLVAWVILLTFLFTSVMPSNFVAGNSVASAAVNTQELMKGKTCTISGNLTNKYNNKWTSSDSSTISISGTGSSITVTANKVSATPVTITHTATNRSGGVQTETFTFTVTNGPTPVEVVDTAAAGITMKMNNHADKQFAPAAGEYTVNGKTGNIKFGLVQNTLGADGYPAFSAASGMSGSLKQYFGGETVNGLFLQDYYDRTGYYHYSSFETAAVKSGNKLLVYEELMTAKNDGDNFYYKRGNFLPYNTFGNASSSQYWNYYDENGKALAETAPRYGEITYKPAEDTDYYFNLELTAPFAQLKDGKVNGKDMLFNFNGDDDMWVFLDGVLVLDIGGIHDAHGGYINFATGEVGVYDCVSNAPPELKRTSIKAQFEAARKYSQDKFDGNTFADYTKHEMKIFFMERGAGASNLKMEFNLPTFSGNPELQKLVEVNEEFTNSDAEFEFYMETAKDAEGDDAAPYTGTATIVSASGTQQIDAVPGGVITLKNGEIAAFDVADGRYIRIKEQNLGADVIPAYQVDSVKSGEREIGQRQEGFESNWIQILPNEEHKLEYTFFNKVETGNLTITKQMATGVTAEETDEFHFQVYFTTDAEEPTDTEAVTTPTDNGIVRELPDWTLYTGDLHIDSTATIDENGIITMKADETAIIADIPVGMRYKVEEILPDGSPYELQTSEADRSGTIAANGNRVTMVNGKPDAPFIQVSKTFTGLKDASELPKDTFQLDVTGGSESYTLTLDGKEGTIASSEQKRSDETSFEKGITYTWRINDAKAGNYTVKESGYGVEGYTWSGNSDVVSENGKSFDIEAANIQIEGEREPSQPGEDSRGDYFKFTTNDLQAGFVFISPNGSNKQAILWTETELSESAKIRFEEYYKDTVKNQGSWESTLVFRHGQGVIATDSIQIYVEGDKAYYGTKKSSVDMAWAGGYNREDAKSADIAVTNTYTPDTKTVAVHKTWNVGSEAEPNVTVYAAAYESTDTTFATPIGDVQSLNADNEWTATFTVPKTKDGTEISYVVKEVKQVTAVDGSKSYEAIAEGGAITLNNQDYTVTYGTDEDGATITNTKTGSTSVSVTKVWHGGDAQNTYVQVFKGTEAVGEKYQLTPTETSHTFTGLEKYDAQGNDISAQYTVKELKEVVAEGGTTSYEPVANDETITISGQDYKVTYGTGTTGVTITNTRTGKVNLTGTKVWVANPNHPESNTLKVGYWRWVGEGTHELFTNQTVTWGTTEETANQFTFENLDKFDADGNEYQYQVAELNADGTMAIPTTGGNITINGTTYKVTYNGNTITNTELRNVTVSKAWSNPVTDSTAWPTDVTTVTVGLFDAQGNALRTNGEQVNIRANQDNAASARQATKKLTSATQSATFTDLPAYDAQGNAITYVVREMNGTNPVAGNDTIDYGTDTYKVSYVVNDDNTAITNTLETTTVTVSKNWVGDDDLTNLRGDNLAFTVTGSNQSYSGTVTLLLSDSWAAKTITVPKYYNGQTITYSVEETNVPAAYAVSYGPVNGTADSGYSVAVTNTLYKADIEFTKTYVGGNRSEGEVAVFKLYNGTSEVETLTADANNGYRTTGGKLSYGVTYTLRETTTPAGYTPMTAKTLTLEKAQDGSYVVLVDNTPVTTSPQGTVATLLLANLETIQNVVIKGSFEFTKAYDGVTPENAPTFTVTEVTANHEAIAGKTPVPVTGLDNVYTITNLESGCYYKVEESTVENYESVVFYLAVTPNATDATVVDVNVTDTYVAGEKDESVWAGDNTLILTNKSKTASIDLIKLYDGENADALGATAEFTVKYNGQIAEEVDVSNMDAQGNVTNVYTFSGLQSGKTYNVVEKTMTGYLPASFNIVVAEVNGQAVASFANVDESQVKVGNNTLNNQRETTKFEFVKEFVNEAGEERVAEFTYTIGAATENNRVAYDSETKTYTMSNLKHGYTYKVSEVPMEGYVPVTFTVAVDADGAITTTGDIEFDGNTFVVKNYLEQVEVTINVDKIWQDAAGETDETKVDEVEVQLFRDKELQYTEDGKDSYTTDGRQLTLTLPKYNQATGHKYTYTLKEKAVEGYAASYVQNGNTITITNRAIGGETVEISGKKVWKGVPTDYNLPSYIVVKLLADDQVVATTQVTEADGWEFTFSNLPKQTTASAIVYTVSEVPVPGFATTITGNAEDGYTITNSFGYPIRQLGDFMVTKHVFGDKRPDKETAFEFVLSITATEQNWTAEKEAKANGLKDTVRKATQALNEAKERLNNAIENFTKNTFVMAPETKPVTTPSEYQFVMTFDDGKAIYAVTSPSALEWDSTTPPAIVWYFNAEDMPEYTPTKGSEQNPTMVKTVLEAIQELAHDFSSLYNAPAFLKALSEAVGPTTPSALVFRMSDVNDVVTSQAEVNAYGHWVENAQQEFENFVAQDVTTPTAIKLYKVTQNAAGEKVEELIGSYTPDQLSDRKTYDHKFFLKDGESVGFRVEATTGSSISYTITEQNIPGSVANPIVGVEYEKTGVVVNNGTEVFATTMGQPEVTSGTAIVFNNYYALNPPKPPTPPDPDPTPDPGPGPQPPVPPTPEEPIDDPQVPTGAPDEPEIEIELDEPETPLGAPQTGDAANAAGMMALLVLAAAGLATTRRKFN